jgi:hypothetical protein
MPATAMAASLLKAIKNSPVGKFPASAGKAGIKQNSPLGKQIAQSDRGKLPPMLGGQAPRRQDKPKIGSRAKDFGANRGGRPDLKPPGGHKMMPIETKGKAPFDMDKFKKLAGRSK